MTSMGKGTVWINGHNIGLYWVSFLNPLGKPSQSDIISEYHPPNVKSWERKSNHVRTDLEDTTPTAKLKCPHHKVIESIEFTSFGNPEGFCGKLTQGSCHSSAKSVAEKAFLGKISCAIPVLPNNLGSINCPIGVAEALAVQANCDKKR